MGQRRAELAALEQVKLVLLKQRPSSDHRKHQWGVWWLIRMAFITVVDCLFVFYRFDLYSVPSAREAMRIPPGTLGMRIHSQPR